MGSRNPLDHDSPVPAAGVATPPAVETEDSCQSFTTTGFQLHGLEPRKPLLSRFEKLEVLWPGESACGLAMVPALAASQEVSLSGQPQKTICEPPIEGTETSDGSRTPPGIHIDVFAPLLQPAQTPERLMEDVDISKSPERRLKDVEISKSPQSPVLASRLRKFLLAEEKQAKLPKILPFNRGGASETMGSLKCAASPPLCEFPHEVTRGLPVPQLSRSLPSPSQASLLASYSEEAFEDEDTLSRTPPDKMLSFSYNIPPTPMAPRKCYKIRSAPLRKKQPRRLQFGDEECDEYSASPPSLTPNNNAASIISDVGLNCAESLATRPVDERCTGISPLEFSEDAAKSSDLRKDEEVKLECPTTPPASLFNSFTHGPPPMVPKKPSRGSSLWRV